ncbi:MAG: hypothetical protein RL065_567 [Bacteroidota bacterium]
MIKKISLLLAALCFFSSQIYAQSNDASSNESKTKVYKYKLKLQPLADKVEIDYYLQNLENESLFECTTGNFNYDKGAYFETFSTLLKNIKADSTEEVNPIENFKKASLKSINNDSARVEVYQNSDYNYSSIIIGNDTLIGTKKINEPTVNYYYLSKKGNFCYTTEFGSLLQLHSTQSFFSSPELPYQILNHNFSVIKIKYLNKMYTSTTCLTNEIPETDNLIYNFQYPFDPNSFPLQFSLIRNNNKYVFEMISEKELPNSKTISKKIKFLQERKFEKLPLNELFQLVGFEY